MFTKKQLEGEIISRDIVVSDIDLSHRPVYWQECLRIIRPCQHLEQIIKKKNLGYFH